MQVYIDFFFSIKRTFDKPQYNYKLLHYFLSHSLTHSLTHHKISLSCIFYLLLANQTVDYTGLSSHED